ncbi:MAG TPA: ATP-binding protein, partial [Anaerolineales bacterium]|nr:ATP-binding protein [Anaerolineales bacterium]
SASLGRGMANLTTPRRSLRPTSLRGRVALGVALPLLVALASFSLAQYLRQRNILEAQARHTAAQLGEVVLGSLRYAMLVNDQKLLATVVHDVGQMDALDQVLIIDLDGIVRFDSTGTQVGDTERTQKPGCQECHAYPPAERPRAVYRTDSAGILRVASPIQNEPACFGCHPSSQEHLGVLLADVPLLVWQERLLSELGSDLALSAAGTLVVTLGVYALVHRVLVRRLEQARAPLMALAAGDLSARLPADRSGDELDQLAGAVNSMADGLGRSLKEEQERQQERQRAIAHERERIARELHDGLSQLLGYVNTKAMAVRLLLRNGRQETAAEHLGQLEEAARELSIDVRESILGLRLASRGEGEFQTALESLVDHTARLSGFPIELHAPPLDGIHLSSETEIHLLRIVQEALTNVRRHARASRAEVRVAQEGGSLQIDIEDNGRGFTPRAAPGGAPHYGLEMMRERAAEIGADVSIDSSSGEGTRVHIRWNLPEV